jgi:hypothetical protein
LQGLLGYRFDRDAPHVGATHCCTDGLVMYLAAAGKYLRFIRRPP